MRIFLLALLLLAGCAAPPMQVDSAPQVFIVRHAEKAAGDDPLLSEAGAARALALAELLADDGVTRIFSTDTRRTRGTAAPLAERLGVAVELYDHRRQADLAAIVRAARENVLVVGHSNTIGALAAEFGVDPGAPVDEAAEYDRLYVITLGENGARGEIRRYGD